ncbi:MAG: carbohydrate ABC transporter permease [Rectinemataceae bacterium]
MAETILVPAGAGASAAAKSARRKPFRHRLANALTGYAFTAPAILLMFLLVVIPVGYTIYLSLFDTSLTKPVPLFFGLKGFQKLFKTPIALMVIRNSLLWTVLVAFFQFALGLATALVLNRTFRLRWLARSLIIIPWVIPGVVAGMVWRLFYDAQFGFLNSALTRLGFGKVQIDWLGLPGLAMASVVVAAIWKGFGFSMLMYLAALQGVPKSLYESAEIDGAGTLQRFLYITLPSIASVIRTTLLLTSIWTFNYFEIIYVMTGGGPIRSTHIAPTYIYELAFTNFNFGNASRFAVLSFLLVSVLSIQYIRIIFKRERL